SVSKFIGYVGVKGKRVRDAPVPAIVKLVQVAGIGLCEGYCWQGDTEAAIAKPREKGMPGGKIVVNPQIILVAAKRPKRVRILVVAESRAGRQGPEVRNETLS